MFDVHSFTSIDIAVLSCLTMFAYHLRLKPGFHGLQSTRHTCRVDSFTLPVNRARVDG